MWKHISNELLESQSGEIRGTPYRAILSQVHFWKGATTILKGSTLQANGSGSAGHPKG